jgi:hypothetical protein
MNRGGLGARSLNIELQNALNPPGEIRIERFGWTFCPGDGFEPYPSGQGRLSSVDLMWRDCAVVQTPVFAPVQETVRWQASRFWPVLSGVAGGA